MIRRHIDAAIRAQIGKYPVLTITGPRQSGKTTLIKDIFADFPYFSLENPDTHALFSSDPKAVFRKYGHRIVLDEVQRLPMLLSYVQGIVDEDREACIVLSGSHNMLMMEGVSQTLAGRVAIFYLQPLSYAELRAEAGNDLSKLELMWRGGYPRVYDRGLDPERFYQNYLETYVQRDVRQIKNIGNLGLFTRFLKLCAGYIGQTINLNALATAAGISQSTAASWLAVLETSFVVYQVPPYFKNFKKRIIKSPKLYFWDTGLACSLLNIGSPETLDLYYQKGAIFENFVFNEISKAFLNTGKQAPLYFWRDSNQHEIDLLIDRGISLQPVEIKLSSTYQQDYFKQLNWFASIIDIPAYQPTVVYGADQSWESDSGRLLSWKEIDALLN